MSQTNLTILRILQNNGNLTVTEHKFMNFLQENVKFVINNSIVQIANASGVSEASISRFVQKKEFKNFNEMKILLAHGQVSEKTNTNATSTLLSQITKDYVTLINDTASLIENQQISILIDKILNSSRVKLYGAGLSGIVAEEIAFSITKLGIMTHAYKESHSMKTDGALSEKDELAIGISLSGTSLDVYETLKAAKKQGTFTVVITNFKDMPITQIADMVIIVPSKNHLEEGNNISPQLVILFFFDYIIGQIVATNPNKFFQVSSHIIHTIFGDHGQR